MEHLVQKMKTTVKRGLVLRYLIPGQAPGRVRLRPWLAPPAESGCRAGEPAAGGDGTGGAEPTEPGEGRGREGPAPAQAAVSPAYLDKCPDFTKQTPV